MDDVLPLQPLVTKEGVVRFRANSLVSRLLDHCKSLPEPYRFGLNELACEDHPQADREQFAMLIGYSLGGFAELSYVSDETYDRAEAAANIPLLREPAVPLTDELEGGKWLMTPEERAKKLVEEFADFAEKYIWGADHLRYKGADEELVKVVTAALAAERERVLAMVYAQEGCYPRGCGAAVAVADLCDEVFDKSGALLGRVRAAAKLLREGGRK